MKKQLKYWISFICFFVFVNTDALQLTGRLEWVERIEMRVLEDGVVQKMNVRIGQHVRKGDILLRMDQRKSKAQLLEAKAMLARGVVKLDDADDELKRTLELFDRGLIAEEELKDAKIKIAAAKAELESAKASKALAEINLERNILRAPMNGIIVATHAYEGSVVYKTQQTKGLIAIAPNTKMLARLLVRSNILGKYRPGQNAKITVNGKHFNGKIYSQGVEAVRIEVGGAVYELDVIFNHSPRDLMRPSDVVTVTLP